MIEADDDARKIAACNLPAYLEDECAHITNTDVEEEKLYPFLTEEEEYFIRTTYARHRRSTASMKKLLILLGAFSNWARKPLFEMDGRDGQRYVESLVERV